MYYPYFLVFDFLCIHIDSKRSFLWMYFLSEALGLTVRLSSQDIALAFNLEWNQPWWGYLIFSDNYSSPLFVSESPQILRQLTTIWSIAAFEIEQIDVLGWFSYLSQVHILTLIDWFSPIVSVRCNMSSVTVWGPISGDATKRETGSRVHRANIQASKVWYSLQIVTFISFLHLYPHQIWNSNPGSSSSCNGTLTNPNHSHSLWSSWFHMTK